MKIPEILPGGGEMGKLIRSHNWQETELGAIETWPLPLKATLGIILNSISPMYLFWGKEHYCFYNDAYKKSVGDGEKYHIIGENAKEVWADIWDNIGPMIRKVMTEGEAFWHENQQFQINRNGQQENSYWTYSYSPVFDEDGKPAGVFVTCDETTLTVESLKKLQISEQRFENFVREATIGVILVSGENFVVEMVNEQYGQLVGRKADELINRPLFEIIPEAEAFFKHILDQVKATGKAIHLNETPYFVLLDGEKKEGFLNVVYQPYLESDGSISGVLITCQNVTESVKNRREIAASEDHLRSVIESAPFPIGVYTGMEMKIQIANQVMLDTYGKGNDAVGKNYTEILPELENQEIFEQLREVFKTGIPFHAKNTRVDIVVEGILQPFYFNYSFTPLFDAAGNIYGVVNTGADVTDLNVANKKMEDSEARFRTMFQQAPIAIGLTRGVDMIFESANQPMLKLIDRDETIIGKSLIEVLPELENQQVIAILKQVYETGEPFQGYEISTNLFTGNAVGERYFNIAYTPFLENNKTIAILHVATDVTEQVINRKRLENSELFSRNIIDDSVVAQLVWIGEDMRISIVNERMLQILGRDNSIIGKTFLEAIPEFTDLPLMDRLKEVLSTGETFVQPEEKILIMRYGQPYVGYYNYTYQALTNASGIHYGIICTAVEITEQVLSRQKVEQSEQRFRALIEQSPIATCLFTGMDMVIELANDKMIDIWGKGQTVIGKPFLEALPEMNGQPFTAILEDIYRTGKTYASKDAEALIVVNGVPGTYYFDFTYKPIFDSDGNVYGIMDMASDVTAQVIAMRQMEQSEAKARLAIESADLGPYEVNLLTDEIETSERFNEIWGISKGMSRERIADYIHPDDVLTRSHAHSLALKTGNLDYETRIVHDDESEHWVKIKGKIIFSENGTPITLLGVIQNITEQKRFAEQLTKQVNERTLELHRSNEDLLQFAHVASHDLKEPIRKIKIFSSMLQEEFGSLLPEKGNTYLKKVQNATERMFAMIEGVLTYSTLNAADQPIEQIDLNEIIENIETDLEVLIHQKNGVVQKLNNLPSIEGASVLIYQLFYNLINNALKFSKIGEPPVIQISAVSVTAEMVAIEVSDNGIGLDPEYIDKIFETFSRLNAKDAYEGTGLGLALCKRIAERHHGTIKASGVKGEGASFTISLPIKQPLKTI